MSDKIKEAANAEIKAMVVRGEIEELTADGEIVAYFRIDGSTLFLKVVKLKDPVQEWEVMESICELAISEQKNTFFDTVAYLNIDVQ